MDGKGFVPAGGLAIGNSIVTRAGPHLVVKSVQWNRRAEGYDVYNFVVEEDHTYFVGNSNGGAWVHNTDCPQVLSRPDRLKELYSRLGKLPTAKSAEESLGQVRNTLNAVEDEFSGVPHDPVPGIGEPSNGRMYPPFNDRVFVNPNGSLTGQTAGHNIELGLDGGISIITEGLA